MMLRDYQFDLYKKTVEAFKQGFHKPLIVAPCGAGKSYMFAEMIRKTHGEALVLTHRQELKQQHEDLFQKLGISNARVAMILTEANRLGEYDTPALIVADEAHLSRSNSWMKVIEHYNTWTVGFTATPVRLDGKPLGDIFDNLIEGVDVKWLIEHKHLAPYEYYAPTLVETDGLRKVAGDYVVSDLEKLMNERAIYGDVIKAYRRFAEGERSMPIVFQSDTPKLQPRILIPLEFQQKQFLLELHQSNGKGLWTISETEESPYSATWVSSQKASQLTK